MKYIKSIKQMYSIKRDHWMIGDLKVVLGDKVKEDSSMRMHPLPDSQSSPISVGIHCENNELRDVKGIKDGWRGGVWIEGNPVYQIFKLFPKARWDEVIECLNEYDTIRGEEISHQGLALVFLEMGKIGDYKMI